jgi:hypothetical protein
MFMRRLGIAALGAALILGATAGAAFAAKPTMTIIDISQFEGEAEAEWLEACGFAVDVEFKGHIIFRELTGPRVTEVDNWLMFMSYSANGKTFVAVHPLAGPDVFWVDADGTPYHAIAGRAPFDGFIGRIVRNENTGEVVFSAGRDIDNPLDDICAAIAP